MSAPGTVFEVKQRARGSQLVGAHTAGATSLVVANGNDFDTAGGMLLLDDKVYTWSSVTPNGTDDDATTTLGGLSPALIAPDKPDTMPVELWSGAQVIDDLMLSVDTGGVSPMSVTLKSGQRKDWSALVGASFPPVAATFADDYSELEDADGYTPPLDASYAQNLPDAPAVAQTAPTTSPAFTVRGFASGIEVLTDPVPNSVLLDFYVDGVLVVTGERSNFVAILTNSTGGPMTADPITTAYSVTVVARNAAGSAPASGPLPGSRDMGYPDASWFYSVFVSVLTAQTAVIGGMSFGKDGITAYDSAGNVVVRIPTDGSGPTFKGQGTFDSLSVSRFLMTGALNYLQGTLFLSNGVTDPTDKPTVTPAGWDSTPISGSFSRPRGMYDDGTRWLVADFGFFYGGVQAISKTTSSGAYPRSSAGTLEHLFEPYSITKVSSTYYVLGVDHDDGDQWKVRGYNSSWVQTANWVVPVNMANAGALGVDGATLILARVDAGGTLRITTHNLTTGAVTATVTGTAWSGQVTSVTKTSTGFAATRYVVATTSSLRTYDSTGNRITADEWPMDGMALGISFDGAAWHSWDGSKVSDYTNLAGAYTFAYSYATPAGPYETGRSDLRSVTLQRQKYTITATAPTAATVTAVRLYAVAGAGSLIRQATVTASPWSQTFSTFLTSGTGTASNNYPTGNAGILSTPTGKVKFVGDDTYALNGTPIDEVAVGAVSGVTSPFTVTLQVRNGSVDVVVGNTGTPTIATGTTTIAPAGSIAVAYRPAAARPGQAVMNGLPAAVRVNTNGSVDIINGTGASRTGVNGAASYPKP